MKFLGRYLFKLSKTPVGGFFVGFGFQFFSWLIPVKRMPSDPKCLVFPHVRPVAKNHILAVPKKRISNLSVLFHPENLEMRAAISKSLSQLMKDQNLSHAGDSFLIANGKEFQDVMQVHFHYMMAKSGKPYLFDGPTSIDDMMGQCEKRFASTGGVILQGETMDSLLMNTDFGQLIDKLFEDDRVKAFSLFAHSKNFGSEQTAGINWSCESADQLN